jgi:hypothetical protein
VIWGLPFGKSFLNIKGDLMIEISILQILAKENLITKSELDKAINEIKKMAKNQQLELD